MEGGRAVNPIVLMHDQRTTIRLIAVILLFTMGFTIWAFIRSWMIDIETVERIKLSQQERLKIAQQNRAEYTEDRRKHDSIRTLEGKIRAAQILELKRKGLWRE